VDLVSTDQRYFFSTKILAKETPLETILKMGEFIEDIRLAAKSCKNRFERLALWREYWDTLNSFISTVDIIYDGRIIKSKSIDYGYSHTIHKSQGGTYKNVYVDFRDIKICTDFQMIDQLLYVALSRPTIKANLFF